MRGHIWAGAAVILACVGFWALCAALQPEKSSRVCVPLYDQTGEECCQ